MTDFIELCRQRHSVRSYTDEPVSEKETDYIMECARLAPSACNRQPWKFLVVTSPEQRKALQGAYDRPWFATATLYIVCLKNTRDNWVRRFDGKPYGDVDVAIAAEHICLAAADLGLGSCWVANFDPEKVRAFYPSPDYEAVAIITIGHAAGEPTAVTHTRKDAADIIERM